MAQPHTGCSVAGADKINTEPYEDLVKILQDHYDPNPSPIVQRFKFNSRVPGPDETVAKYVAALRALAEHCFYGDVLDDMLRDRLVCGVQQDSIQQRLLAEKDLTYQKALELATAMEAAAQGSQDMKRASGFSHATNQGIHWNSSKEGGKSTLQQIPFPEANSRKIDHQSLPVIAVEVNIKLMSASSKKQNVFTVRSKDILQRYAEPSKEVNIPSKPITWIRLRERTLIPCLLCRTRRVQDKKSPGAMTLELTLNTVPVSMELDTGAALSLINMATYHKIAQSSQLPLQKSDVILRTYTGEHINIRGSVEVKVYYQGKTKTLRLQVVEGEGPNLLGHDWLETLQVRLNCVCNLVGTINKGVD